MKEIPVTLKSGGKQLVGMLHLPKRKNAPVVVMFHGWATGKYGSSQFTYVRFARILAMNGFVVLRLDFSGVGDSEGSFSDHTLHTNMEDAVAALKFVRKLKNVNNSKIGLLGWSMGGTVAIFLARKSPAIKCLSVWAAPANYQSLWKGYEKLLEEIRKKKFVTDSWNGLPKTWKSTAISFEYDSVPEVKKISSPILIVNGTRDTLVSYSHAKELYRNANEPKKLVLIKGANHGFFEETHKNILFRETLNWFRKYLE